jgi:hypothetical protein
MKLSILIVFLARNLVGATTPKTPSIATVTVTYHFDLLPNQQLAVVPPTVAPNGSAS